MSAIFQASDPASLRTVARSEVRDQTGQSTNVFDPAVWEGKGSWRRGWPPSNTALKQFPVAEVSRSSSSLPSFDSGTAMASEVAHPVASQLLAEWHGQVTDVLADAFAAQLKGRHGVGVAGMEDDALIPLDDVREDDRALLAPGAFFRLCISYEIRPSGQKRRFTEVIFRRMPAYRRDELEVAQRRGQEIARGLRLE